MKRLPQSNGSNWLTPAWILGPFAALLVFVGILSWLKERPFLPVDNYGGNGPGFMKHGNFGAARVLPALCLLYRGEQDPP